MKKLNFQVENWFDCKEQMEWLFSIHWEEVAHNKQSIKLNLWHEQYDELAKNGELRIITARDDDKIVGYYWVIIKPHLHYKQSLTAFTDVFFLHPLYRKGFTGVKLFKFVEQYLKEIGVQRVISTTKIKHDKSSIFKRLKWDKVEIVYSKILN